MITRVVSAAEAWLFGRRKASYGVAVVRIVFGVTALGFLAANWTNRHYLWGDAAQWTSPLDRNGGFGFPFTAFAGGGGQVELTVKLLVLAALLVALVLGWRTRVIAPLVLVGWVSLIESNAVYGDQSDNIVRILLIYLCFADLSGRLSMDARRRARRRKAGGAAPRRELTLVGNLLHNLAVVAVGTQICMIYIASGLYKASGGPWQDGTAVYYPLQVTHYQPWPGLNELLSGNGFGVAVASYFSVVIQLAFPLMLLWRPTRIVALVGVAAMHLGIAVVMGLPFFSLFIMAGDQIFVRDSTYAAALRWVKDRIPPRWRDLVGRTLPLKNSRRKDQSAVDETISASPTGHAKESVVLKRGSGS